MKNTVQNEHTFRLKHMNCLQKMKTTTAYRSTYRCNPRAAGTYVTTMRCIARICIALSAFIIMLSAAQAQAPQKNYGIAVAVLPFEVFSIEKEPALGSEVAALITRQLSLNPAIIGIDSQRINAVIQPDGSPSLTEARLRQIAKHLNANCIIMGTVTKIRSEHSIDVEMFTTAAGGSNFKTFSEGLEIKTLVETLATALDQEIMDKAAIIPTAERPQVSTGRQSSPRAASGGFDVDRELLAAFGPMHEQNRPASPEQAKPAKTTTPAASALRKQTSEDATLTQAASESATPAADLPPRQKSAPVAAQLPNVEKPAKPKPDSGFFSLSKAISINADSMEYDNRANMAKFKGNVVARQDDIVMFATTMHVYYSEGGGLARVEAQGNVRVVQGDRIATGSSIVFNNATQTIVATGNPRVWQGDNVVHGRTITVYLKEERTVVEGEPDSRASATIYPDSDTKRP